MNCVFEAAKNLKISCRNINQYHTNFAVQLMRYIAFINPGLRSIDMSGNFSGKNLLDNILLMVNKKHLQNLEFVNVRKNLLDQKDVKWFCVQIAHKLPQLKKIYCGQNSFQL